MYEYRCEICGCYLDPGEGRRCEDCLRAERKRPADMYGQILENESFEHAEDAFYPDMRFD